jgi:hypothetical protein
MVLLYQATAEALLCTLRAHAQGGESLEEVHQHRARLAELDDALAQLGWCPDQPTGSLELRASSDVLHDAAYGALIDAGERLATACSSAWRAELSVESVADVAKQVTGFSQLLRSIDGGLAC